ncbi:MAG: hypothetical protein AAF401_19230 [Pseudomonadota bacterium]
MMWNAVVLAGDRNPKDPVARAGLTPHKSAAPVGDRRLIDFPLAALGAMMDEGRIGRIIVALAPGAPEPAPGPWDCIEAGDDVISSVDRAYQTVGAPLLVTTCDAAMLTPEILTEFLDRSEDGPELSAAIIPAALAEPTPEAPPRPTFALKEGRYVGANLFAIATATPAPAFEGLAKLNRRPTQMLASALSWKLRPPTIATVEAKAAKRLGCSAQIVELSASEAGFEVNTALDLVHFRQRWAAWLSSEQAA